MRGQKRRIAAYDGFVANGSQENEVKHPFVAEDEEAGARYRAVRQRTFKRQQDRYEQNEKPRESDLRLDMHRWRDFFWKPTDSIEAKVEYVLSFGHVSSTTSAADIASYLLTLYDMGQPDTLRTMTELLFAKNAADVDQTIRDNLQACFMIDPKMLVDTPLHNYEFYRQLIMKLSNAHAEYVRYETHFVSAIQAFAQQRPMDPLLSGPNALPPPEPAPRDIDGSERAIVDRKPWQLLLAFLLVQANAQGLRRDATAVYRPVFHNRNFTHFYVRHADMDMWIYDQVNEKDHAAHYDALTKDKKTLEYLLYHLPKIPDVRFPKLRVCRSLFSYANGVFNADNNKFYPYICPLTLDADPDSRLGDIATLPPDVGTAQFFEGVTLPIAWFTQRNFDWAREIQTPNIDKIFLDQDYDAKDLHWVRAVHGRALHDISARHEDWQIIVHTKGPAGCGKSVIGKVLKSWYPKERFGVLNDDMQENFPDSHLAESWVVVCFDASPDFALSPTRFLCWASGDDVTINVKFMEPIVKAWTAPVFFFSNYEMPVQGGSGSAIRRGLILSMDKAVLKADGQLTRNAVNEAGYYLIKCTLDYHDKCRRYGKQSIWDDPSILPERFWQGREQYAKASSWQDAFLLSGRFMFGPDLELSVDAFKREYANFQQVQKALPGVNRSRKYGRNETRVPPCAPSEFANALRSVRKCACYWDTNRNVIVGLNFAQDPQDEALAAQPPPNRLTMSQRSKRPRELDPNTSPQQKTPHIDFTPEEQFTF